MRIQVLSDNKKLNHSLENEHGLCIYLETDKYKCLLDAGASDQFIANAQKMEVDLAEIDYVFISHGHADHTGGLQEFLKINTKAKIIVSKNALTQRFFSIRKGLHEISSTVQTEGYEDRFVYIDSERVFENEIHVFPCNTRLFPMPKGNSTLMKGDDNERTADDFNHEIIVCFGNEKLLVYCGCAHSGVLNILHSVKQTLGKTASALIGGFHLIDGNEGEYETEEEILSIGDELKNNFSNTQLYTGHCTGEKAYAVLKKKLHDQIHSFYTGFTFTYQE